MKGLLALLALCLAVTASAELSNNTVVPVNSAPLVASGAVQWPLDPVTKHRYPGIKEYAIVLHDHLVYEKAELDAWFNHTYKQKLKGALANLKELRNTTAAKTLPYDKRIKHVQLQIHEVQKTLAKIHKDIATRTAGLKQAEKVVLNTAINWNNTIAGLQLQRRAALRALADVKRVSGLLEDPTHREDVAKILMTTQAKIGQKNTKVSSLLEMAIEQAQTARGVAEMKQLIAKLDHALVAHATDLLGDLTIAQNSRTHHLKVLRSKIQPYTLVLSRLRDSAKITASSLPSYQAMIKSINAEALSIYKAVQVIDNRIQRVKDTMTEVNAIYVSESASVKARMQTFEELHQELKQKLLTASDNDKKILLGCKNILKPMGKPVDYWNPYFQVPGAKTNFSTPVPVLDDKPYGMSIPNPVDPADTQSNLCGSWRFEEANGNPYAIDNSGYGHDGWLHGMDLQRMQGHSKSSHALLFDGMQSYVDLGRMSYFGESLNSFTISMWVRTLDTHPALSSLVKYIDDDIAGVLSLEPNRRVGRPINGVYPVGQQGETTLDFQAGATLGYLRDSKGNVLAGHVMAPYFDNKWHHIQWTVMDAKNNKMAFYMDKKLYPWVATIENSPSVFRKLHRNIYIGAGNNRGRPEGFFDGAIDDVRFFCGKNISVSGGYCCRTCTGETQACGDMCVPKGKMCHLPKGCACEPAVPVPPPQPIAPKPTPAPEHPQYYRGNTTMNKKTLFTPNAVPQKSDPALKKH